MHLTEVSWQIHDRWLFDADDEPSVGHDGPDKGTCGRVPSQVCLSYLDHMTLLIFSLRYLLKGMSLYQEDNHQQLTTNPTVYTPSSDGQLLGFLPYQTGIAPAFHCNAITVGPCPLILSSPHPLVFSSPCPLVPSSPCSLVPLSPCPLVPSSPCPLVPLSPRPLVLSSLCPLVPSSPCPLVPQTPSLAGCSNTCIRHRHKGSASRVATFGQLISLCRVCCLTQCFILMQRVRGTFEFSTPLELFHIAVSSPSHDL